MSRSPISESRAAYSYADWRGHADGSGGNCSSRGFTTSLADSDHASGGQPGTTRPISHGRVRESLSAPTGRTFGTGLPRIVRGNPDSRSLDQPRRHLPFPCQQAGRVYRHGFMATSLLVADPLAHWQRTVSQCVSCQPSAVSHQPSAVSRHLLPATCHLLPATCYLPPATPPAPR